MFKSHKTTNPTVASRKDFKEMSKDPLQQSENPGKILRTLSVQGQGDVKCTPDTFQMTVCVTSSKPSLEEAQTSVKKRTDYIQQVSRNHGVSGECIKLHTDIYHDNNNNSQLQSVTVDARMNITTGDIDKCRKIRNILIEKLSGSIQCNSIHCSISSKHRAAQRYMHYNS